jgi:hypothetical protein
MSWFAQEGMKRGFHADQEVVYPEPKELSFQKKRKADLVWVTDPERDLADDVFVLHLESETDQRYVELTIDLVAYSPFKPLPAAVAFLHRKTAKKSKRDFLADTLGYAIKRFRGKERTLLLIMDMVWDEGDPFYGYIIDGKGKHRKRLAAGVLHKWRSSVYYGLKLEE